MAVTMRACSKCLESKPATLANFHRAARGRDGLSPYCIPCNRKINRDNHKIRKAKAARVGATEGLNKWIGQDSSIHSLS